MESNKKTLRLKLTDFLGKNIERDIIEFLEIIENENDESVFLKLWYSRNEVSHDRILEFQKKYSNILSKLNVNIYVLTTHDFTWYDIINELDINKSDGYMFRTTYKNINEIFNALVAFNNYVKFSSNIKFKKTENSNGKSVSNRFKQLRESEENKRSIIQIKKKL